MDRARLGIATLVALSFGLFAACASIDASPIPLESHDSLGAGDASDGSVEARGAALVNQLGCHGCHDSTAGVMTGNAAGVQRRVGDAGIVRVFPANLTPAPKTGIGTAADGWSDAQLASAIRSGVDDECLTLCKVMPHYNLSDADMTAVIAYLRGLPPVENDVVTQGCPSLSPTASGAGQFVDAGSCPAP